MDITGISTSLNGLLGSIDLPENSYVTNEQITSGINLGTDIYKTIAGTNVTSANTNTAGNTTAAVPTASTLTLDKVLPWALGAVGLLAVVKLLQ